MDWREKFERLRQKHSVVVKEVRQQQQPLPVPASVPASPAPVSNADLRLKNFKEMKLSRNKVVVPNLLGRYKIFRAIKKGRRKYYHNKTKIEPYYNLGIDGLDLYIEGKELNQHDLNVWLWIVKKFHKQYNDNYIVSFSGYELLKFLNQYRPSKKGYQYLDDVIKRLMTTLFTVQFNYEKKYRFRSSLILSEKANLSDKTYCLNLSDPLVMLFSLENWSLCDFSIRLALKQKELAQEFQLFLTTHKSPFWATKDVLYQDFGSEYKDKSLFLKDFRRRVIKPLQSINFIKKIEEKETAIGFFY